MTRMGQTWRPKPARDLDIAKLSWKGNDIKSDTSILNPYRSRDLVRHNFAPLAGRLPRSLTLSTLASNLKIHNATQVRPNSLL